MVSARRPAAWIAVTVLTVSGGTFLLSLTKPSKAECTVRTNASTSRLGSSASSTSSNSQAKKGSWLWKRRILARTLPSTSTLTVPSGSRSSWMIEPSVPTG